MALVQRRLSYGESPSAKAISTASHDRCSTFRGRCGVRARAPVAGQPWPSAQIVITRSRGEDLRWLDSLPEIPAVVYDRNGLDELLPSPRNNLVLVSQVQDPELSKLGPEDGVLRHIVSTYDSLPEVTVFLQGWPFQHCADARALLKRAISNVPRPYDADFLMNGAEAGLVPLSATFSQYGLDEGFVGPATELVRSDEKLYDQSIGAEALGTLAFNRTCSKLLGRSCNISMWFPEGGQWAVSRDRIRKSPKSRYESALQVSVGSGGRMREVVLEAIWQMFWGAPAWEPGLAHVRSAQVVSTMGKVRSSVGAVNNYCVFSTDGGSERDCEEDAGFCHYARSAPVALGSEGTVDIQPILGTAELVKLCPAGYTFSDGDAPGYDQFGHDKYNLKETIQQCADHCSRVDGCLSFEWSAATKQCNMNKVANPTDIRFGDAVFCRSDLVPAADAVDLSPEMKVPAYLEGKIGAVRAREMQAKEAENDLVSRIESAWRNTSRPFERRMHCAQRHLPPPELAVVGKPWRLLSIGYPYYHIQVADLTSCIHDPATRSKRGIAPCSSNKPNLRWEIREVAKKGFFQLVSKTGKCLVPSSSGLAFSTCEDTTQEHSWQLDMERTGKYYDKLSMEMIESHDERRLHLRCVTQLHGLEQQQTVHWRMVDASDTHGRGAYFLARRDAEGSEAYLGCQEGKKTPEAILSPAKVAWHFREAEDGSVHVESEEGLLQYEEKKGWLYCYKASRGESGVPPGTAFALRSPLPGL